MDFLTNTSLAHVVTLYFPPEHVVAFLHFVHLYLVLNILAVCIHALHTLPSQWVQSVYQHEALLPVHLDILCNAEKRNTPPPLDPPGLLGMLEGADMACHLHASCV